MIDTKLIKVLGKAAYAIGIGASLMVDWANDKRMDEKISRKIAEALAKQKGNGS